MYLIQCNKTPLAVGLNWSRLPGEKVSAEMAALSSEMGLKFGVSRKLEEAEGSYIHQVGLSDDKSSSGKISGAAIFADLSDTAILIQKVTDESFWLCCSLDSEVVPDGDQIVNINELNEKFNNLYSIIEGQNCRLFADASIHDLFSEIFEDKQFEDILEEHEVKSIVKEYAHYRLKNLKGVPRAVFLLAGFVIVLGGAAYMMTSTNSPVIVNMPPVVNEQLPPEIIKPTIKEEVIKGPTEVDILSNALNEEIEWLKEEMSVTEPSSIVSAISDFNKVTPRNFAGWKVNKIFYIENGKHEVGIEWLKGPLGTSLTLKDSVKGYSEIVYALSGDKAITKHPVANLQGRQYNDVLLEIRNDPYKIENLLNDLTIRKLSYKIDQYKNTDKRREEIQGLKSQKESKKAQLELSGKKFYVEGIMLSELEYVANMFEKSKAFKINKIDINIISNTWSIEGVLYEK